MNWISKFLTAIAKITFLHGNTSSAPTPTRRDISRDGDRYNAHDRSRDYQQSEVLQEDIRKLHKMLSVAAAEGSISSSTEEVLKAFAAESGIAEYQYSEIRSRVLIQTSAPRTDISTQSDEGAIAPQRSRVAGDSKAPIHYSEELEFLVSLKRGAINGFKYVVEFADSSSAAFPKALSVALESDRYERFKDFGKVWHRASYSSENVDKLCELGHCLSGLRNKKIFVGGEEITWGEFFHFSRCASERRKAYRPDEYCNGRSDGRVNLWGCRQAGMGWQDADWMMLGSWESAERAGRGKVDVWRFDKKRIRHQLATRLYDYRFCPHLKPEFFDALIQFLPEAVEPSCDANWKYRRVYTDVPGSILVVRELFRDGYIEREEFNAFGVVPVGFDVFDEIVANAGRESLGFGCGVLGLPHDSKR